MTADLIIIALIRSSINALSSSINATSASRMCIRSVTEQYSLNSRGRSLGTGNYLQPMFWGYHIVRMTLNIHSCPRTSRKGEFKELYWEISISCEQKLHFLSLKISFSSDLLPLRIKNLQKNTLSSQEDENSLKCSQWKIMWKRSALYSNFK